ncbi:hypothetical protein V8B97DRAFT_1915391 [Scleroderma yunnanense]
MALIQDIRSYIQDATHPLEEKLHLQVLSEFADTIVFATFFFFVLHKVLSPIASRALFPVAYGKASKKTRNNCPTVFNSASEFGFVFHGIACLCVFLLGSRPFAQYYGVRFLFWEVSTIFLDIHWFLDKTGKTGSKLQLINGFVLLGTFFSHDRKALLDHHESLFAKPPVKSYDFIKTMRSVYEQLPFLYVAVYGGGNILLNLLNWFWFTKMISALQKRFPSQPNGTSHRHHPKANDNKSL